MPTFRRQVIEKGVHKPHLYSPTDQSMIKWSIRFTTCTQWLAAHKWQLKQLK